MTWDGLTPPYRTIVADPPWHYDGYAVAKNGRDDKRERPMEVRPLAYSSMSVAEISALPVAQLAAPDCCCFLWTTNAYLPDSFSVLSAWGFKYRQTLVWHKTGNPSPFGGSIAPNHAEFVLLGVTGRPGGDRLRSSVWALPRSVEHSRKPDAVLDDIEACARGPRVELFARRQRLGWDSWGYGYEQIAEGEAS